MEQVFTVPEGFEIKKISDNQFSIVEKKDAQQVESQLSETLYSDHDNDEREAGFYHDIDTMGNLREIKERQMRDVVTRRNSFFKTVDNRDDYDFDAGRSAYYDKELRESRDRDALWNERYANPYDSEGNLDYSKVQRTQGVFHEMYESGKIKKLNEHEMGLLRFCDGIDVRGFLKEEFKNNPINISRDDNGNVQAEAPNGVENLGRTNPNAYKWKWHDKQDENGEIKE